MAKESNPFLAHISGGLWLMEPQALERLAATVANNEIAARALDSRAWDDDPDNGDDESDDADPYTLDGDVARIRVSGVLMDTVPKWYSWYGIDATAYRDIGAAIDAANKDPRVGAIQLDVDSPGGYSDGVHAAADAIINSKKTVSAHVDTLAASAAYWLASQADEVTAVRGANVGSIGVYTVRYDTSQMYQNVGVKVHLITTGGVKGAGVDGVPLSEAALKDAQRGIDSLLSDFIADVSRGRGASPTDINALADGRVWSAPEAKGKGLVDRITADPAADRKAKMAKSLETAHDLIKQYGNDYASMIMEMAVADKTEEEIKVAVEAAKHTADLAKERAGYQARITDLEGHVAALTKDKNEATAKLAEVTRKYESLSALAAGTKEAGKVKADAAQEQTMKSSAFKELGGKAQASFIKAGGKVIAD